MPFKITIKGKNSFFKKAKKVNISDIIKKLGFEIGYYNDAYVLQLGETKDNTCILYNPKSIGRGIFLDLGKFNEDNQISLLYNIPTTKTEINDFFDLSKEIIDSFGNVELYNEDETFTVNSFFAQKESMIAFSLAVLNQKASTQYNDNNWIITTAMFPYTFSDEERESFSKATSLDEFEKRLHEIQLLDVYYAKPTVMHEKNRDINIGVYSLTENCRSVFPIDGTSSLVTVKLNTEINDAWVCFAIYSEQRLLEGYYNYNSFVEYIKEYTQPFDKGHIVIEPMSKEELIKIADYLKENGDLVV